jgi:hypothetical protein
MRIFIILSVCFIACNSNSSTDKPPSAIAVEEINVKQLPGNLKYLGDATEAWKWKDSLGENILLLTYDFHPDASDTSLYSYELFAYHFYKKDTGYKVLWRINDIVEPCDFDLTAEFIDSSTMITDLDNDGTAETTVQYKTACRSDVSPAAMKLIMHEGADKYALRGSMWLKAGLEDEFTVTEKDVNLETLPGYKGTDEEWDKRYGRYETEKDFKNAPPGFLSFARGQWMKYVKEKMGVE